MNSFWKKKRKKKFLSQTCLWSKISTFNLQRPVVKVVLEYVSFKSYPYPILNSYRYVLSLSFFKMFRVFHLTKKRTEQSSQLVFENMKDIKSFLKIQILIFFLISFYWKPDHVLKMLYFGDLLSLYGKCHNNAEVLCQYLFCCLLVIPDTHWIMCTRRSVA